jgi:hypothetical protein
LVLSLDATIDGCRPLHYHLPRRLAYSLSAARPLNSLPPVQAFKPSSTFKTPAFLSFLLETPTNRPRCQSQEPLRPARSSKVSTGMPCLIGATPPSSLALSDIRSQLRSNSFTRRTICLTMLQTFSPRHPDPTAPHIDPTMTCPTAQRMSLHRPRARIWILPRGRCRQSRTICPVTSHLPPRPSRPPHLPLPLRPRLRPLVHRRHLSDQSDHRRRR